MAESAQQRYDRWVNDALHTADAQGLTQQIMARHGLTDQAQLRPLFQQIARGGIDWAAANEPGFDRGGFDTAGAAPNTLNPGQAAAFLAAGNRPDQYHTDARGLTLWGPHQPGPSPGNWASGRQDAYAGHTAPDWGAMLGNPVQPPATMARVDSGPGGPRPSTPSGTIFPTAPGADAYAGHGASPGWDNLLNQAGGHTMSMPNPDTQTGYGAPAGAQPVTGVAATTSPTDPRFGVNRETRLQGDPNAQAYYLLQLLGVDPTMHSLRSDFARKSLAPLVQAWLESTQGLGGGYGENGMTNAIQRFAGMLGGGNAFGTIAADARAALANPEVQQRLTGMGVTEAAPYLQGLQSLMSANVNPFIAKGRSQALSDALLQYGMQDIQAGPTGTLVNPERTLWQYISQLPEWRQRLGLQ